jgi:polyhydroxyalkanoate synthesis regulator phasin
MTTTEEFRKFADECMKAAREAKTDVERKAFLDMARAWTKAAAQSTPDAPLAPH